MSCVAKYDAYFNKLNNTDCKSIVIPADSMILLSNNVHHFQKSKTRNTTGLYLSCKTVKKNLGNNTFKKEFTVRVDGEGRWDEKKNEAN